MHKTRAAHTRKAVRIFAVNPLLSDATGNGPKLLKILPGASQAAQVSLPALVTISAETLFGIIRRELEHNVLHIVRARQISADVPRGFGASIRSSSSIALQKRNEGQKERKDNSMKSIQLVETSKTEAIPAPFPNTKGTATIKILNSDQSFGPAVAILRMEPGSEIARHVHGQTTEMSYVLDGDFIKNVGHLISEGYGIQYQTERCSWTPYDQDWLLRPGHLQLPIYFR